MAQRYPKEFKEQVLLEVKEIGNVAQVAKRHNVSDKSIYRWIAEAQHKDWQETPGTAKQIEAYVPSAKEFKDLESENIQLKGIVGEKELEIAILREILKKTNQRSLKRLR